MNYNKVQLRISKLTLDCFASFAPAYACFAVKKKLIRFLGILCLLLNSTLIGVDISAQDEKVSEIIASIAEELADDETYPEAAELFSERLYDLIEKPVRINSADESELSRLFFLTDFQVKALADYIRS